MSLREHSKTKLFRALFVTKCVSIDIERKQSFQCHFASAFRVCVHTFGEVQFSRKKNLKRKQKQTNTTRETHLAPAKL